MYEYQIPYSVERNCLCYKQLENGIERKSHAFIWNMYMYKGIKSEQKLFLIIVLCVECCMCI